MLRTEEQARTLYKDFTSILDNSGLYSSETLAVSFYLENRWSWNGIEGGGFASVAYQHFKNFKDDNILRTSELLQENVTITNNDYSDLMQAPGNECFIFLDPPYTDCGCTRIELYGRKGVNHKYFNHQRFLREIKRMDHPFFITYDDSAELWNSYKDYRIIPFERFYSSSKRPGNQIGIFNYYLKKELA